MRYFIAVLILAMALPVMGQVYMAVSPDGTVADRADVQVKVTTTTEHIEFRTLGTLLAEIAQQEAIRDAAIERIRELAAEIAVVEAEVDKVELAKPEPTPEPIE